jgi:hypothetical protein
MPALGSRASMNTAIKSLGTIGGHGLPGQDPVMGSGCPFRMLKGE